MFGDRRPTFANVVSVLALVVALCGGAYAAGLGKNSVGSKQLKKGAVKTKKIADGAVTSPKIADGAVETNDLAPGVLPSVPDSYTKAESDARYYTKDESDSRYLSSGGTTVLQASPVDWQSTNAAFSGNIAYDVAGVSMTTGVATNGGIAISPTLPAELAGQPQRLVGVNACYDTIASTTLTQVRLNVTENTNGSGNTSSPLVDATARTDAACRDYIPTTPITLDSTHSVTLEFNIAFAGGGGNQFFAGRTTFTLEPAP
jgi:hypothetical protein